MSVVTLLVELAADILRGAVKSESPECGMRCLEIALATGTNPNVLASFLNRGSVSKVEAEIAAARRKR